MLQLLMASTIIKRTISTSVRACVCVFIWRNIYINHLYARDMFKCTSYMIHVCVFACMWGRVFMCTNMGFCGPLSDNVVTAHVVVNISKAT